MPPQITCASALPSKTGKHENHFFTQMLYIESAAAVGRTMYLCAVFMKEKNVGLICDVLDGV